MKHLSTLRKRKNFDSLSSGERKGNSLNRVYVITRKCCTLGVVGFKRTDLRIGQKVTNQCFNRKGLEKPATDGDSPVCKKTLTFWFEFLSTTRHVKSRGNPGRPLPKAKYSLVTDSELVP